MAQRRTVSGSAPRQTKPYRIVFRGIATREDGSSFRDHDVHRVLERKGFRRLQNGRGKKMAWSRCSVKDVEAMVLAVKNGWENSENRIAGFSMLLEQERAVGKRLGISLCSRQRIARRSFCGARRCASEGVCSLWAGEADRVSVMFWC